MFSEEYDEIKALRNIYKYIEENRTNYSFKFDGLHCSIIADVILKITEISIHGMDITIVVDDGVEFFTHIIKNEVYSGKFKDLIKTEFEKTIQKQKKYKKNDERKFFKIVLNLY